MSGIFLIRENGLLEMSEQSYELERELQELLSAYPNLLPGNQISSGDPLHWLFVAREVTLPSGFLDHLFLDQYGVPTLIEVKRSTDTRIRREVVGQLLDYAANAVEYLPVATIITLFAETHRKLQLNADDVLKAFLEEQSPDEFWKSVQLNLDNGTIRLIFVADEIPIQLQRIVEFLNGQMDQAEVLAVEIKKFAGGEQKAFMPRLVGQTVKALERKESGRSERKRWDKETYFAKLESAQDAEVIRIARKIYDWSESHTARIEWIPGDLYGGFAPQIGGSEGEQKLFKVDVAGNIQFSLPAFNKPPFTTSSIREQLIEHLYQIPGMPARESGRDRPSIELGRFTQQSMLDELFKVLDWIVQEAKQPKG